MRNSGKGGSASRTHRSRPDVRKDRRSATGMSGSPKKGGHGGKFTWSGGDGYYSPAEMGCSVVRDVVDLNGSDGEAEAEDKSPVADS